MAHFLRWAVDDNGNPVEDTIPDPVVMLEQFAGYERSASDLVRYENAWETLELADEFYQDEAYQTETFKTPEKPAKKKHSRGR